MSRTARYAPGGMVFHVLNRGVGRRILFDKQGDYSAFENVIGETLRTCPMRICAYALMPNHWHFVLWPERDGDLPRFMRQMTNTHVKRWQCHRHETGHGHLYQGRYKSFPVESDDHFYQVVRYVERNPLRSNLVTHAGSWPWSSLGRREPRSGSAAILSSWPLPRPDDWRQIVGQPQSEAELRALRHCVSRGCPFGHTDWVAATATQLGLESTLRERGRPRRRT